MRLAQIAEIKKGFITIPETFRRVLGIQEGSSVWVREIDRSRRPLEHRQVLITTLPHMSWSSTRLVSTQLRHRPGALKRITEILRHARANVLLMEGYGHYTADEGWWSSVIEFSDQDTEEQVSYLLENLKANLETDALEATKEGRQPSGQFEKDRFTIGPSTNEPQPSLQIVASRRPLASLEPLQLNELTGRTIPIAGIDEIKPQKIKKGRVYVGRTPHERSGHSGLLLCSTEDRFLRVVMIPQPVQIDLVVEMSVRMGASNPGGFLAELTTILANVDVSGSKKGINIAFTYNYITDRALRAEREGEPRRLTEESVIRFYLTSPSAWGAAELGIFCEKWKKVFSDLLSCEVSGDVTARVVAEKCRMRIWHGKTREFRANGRKQVREVGRIMSLSRRLAANQTAAVLSFLLTAALILVSREYATNALLSFVLGLMAGATIPLWIVPIVNAIASKIRSL